jgi:DNA-binding MarR family transcriptional regulator
MKPHVRIELVTKVMATADAFLREGHKLFRPFGLTSAQYNVLNILIHHPDGLSQRELGDRLVVDRSNVTGLLDRLEKSGRVRRKDDPEDRRVYRVSLTPAGQALWARVHPRYLDVVAQVTRGLPVSGMRACLDTLSQLESRAAEWKLPPNFETEKL